MKASHGLLRAWPVRIGTATERGYASMTGSNRTEPRNRVTPGTMPRATAPKSAPVYADTSLLCSLYLRDANTAAVTAHLTAHNPALVFTPWQRGELRNAVRLAVLRGNATAAVSQQALADIDQDTAAGDLVETHLVWPDVLAQAEKLSAAHTATLAVRTLDLLHVAAALTLGAKNFLTCDGRQLALARAAGLRAMKF